MSFYERHFLGKDIIIIKRDYERESGVFDTDPNEYIRLGSWVISTDTWLTGMF